MNCGFRIADCGLKSLRVGGRLEAGSWKLEAGIIRVYPGRVTRNVKRVTWDSITVRMLEAGTGMGRGARGGGARHETVPNAEYRVRSKIQGEILRNLFSLDQFPRASQIVSGRTWRVTRPAAS